MAGTGNRFAVVDARAVDAKRRAWLAREVCAHAWECVPDLEGRLDGLLVVATPGAHGADVAMEVWNADGSRAETCGNGLRVVGKYVGERALANRGELSVSTDAGVRVITLERVAERVVAATTTLGRASVFDGGVARAGPRELAPDWIEIGNRHAVLFAPAARPHEIKSLGPLLEGAIESGANVEIATPPRSPSEPFTVRVWERGVGETAACGSGACAVATAARARGLAGDTVDLDFPGGRLRVTWATNGECLLSGGCEELGRGIWAAFPAPSRC